MEKRRRLLFWYYFLLFSLGFVIFAIGNFSGTTPSQRLLVGLFFLFAVAAPYLFRGRLVSVYALPSSEAGGKLVEKEQELQASIREVGELKKVIASLEGAGSQDDISTIIHQFKTPLAGIRWTFELLRKGEFGQIPAEALNYIKRGEETAARLVTMLSGEDFTTYHLVPLDLVELVEGVIFEFGGVVKQKQITLTLHQPAQPLPAVAIDRPHFTMVLENLIDNAIKYSPAGSAVTINLADVKLHPSAPQVELRVTDEGIGIRPTDAPKIFNRFFRSEAAAKMAPAGRGLGLHIAREIIKKHGGTLGFKSPVANGKGTEFHLTLPIAQTGV
jgi:signal transduction histidine kinase